MLRFAGHELGTAICKALGIDPDITRSVTITISSQGIPAYVTVEQIVLDEKADDIATVFKEYQLAHKEDAP